MDKKVIAYEYIKRKIIEGEFPPLGDISEEELQEKLGISRTPVREALQRLGEEGFVTVYPRKGTIVTDISLDLIYWLYEVRELNEPYIFRSACGRLKQSWLEEMLREFQSFSKENNIVDGELRKKYIDLDAKLHSAVADTCRNDLLRNFMRRVNEHSHRVRVKTSTANREYADSIGEHIEILEAFLAKDQDRVQATALRHIQAAKQVAFKYY